MSRLNEASGETERDEKSSILSKVVSSILHY